MRTGTKTKITGFHQDEYEHWVADLSCGHSKHFRHEILRSNKENGLHRLKIEKPIQGLNWTAKLG